MRGTGCVILSEVRRIYHTSSPHLVGKSPACVGLRSIRENEKRNGLLFPECFVQPFLCSSKMLQKSHFRLGELQQWQLFHKYCLFWGSFTPLPCLIRCIGKQENRRREGRSSCCGTVSLGLQPTPEEPMDIKCKLSAFALLFYIKLQFHSTEILQNERRGNNDKVIDCKLSV